MENKLKEAQAVACIKNNPKYFYKYAANKSKVRVGVGPLTDQNGRIIKEPADISEALSQHYQSVFSNPVNDKIIEAPLEFFHQGNESTSNLTDIELTTSSIEKAINEMSSNSAAGPDQFPAVLLKNCAKELTTPLLLLYRNSLDSGIIPKQLKSAKITPIFKGGSRGDAKNYRPIALTSHVIKILEKVIVKNISTYLEENGKMNPHQHGFRAGRSCLSQLLAHYEDILEMLEHNKNADVVYLDFKAAFDKVDHGILLHKVRQVGISGRLGVWLHSFLADREQSVAVDGAVSMPTAVASGVPQGTVLGPLLFLIHILDINEHVRYSSVASFADDTRILREVLSVADSELLQADLASLYTWAEQNNMSFNNNKFQHINYCTGTKNITYTYKAQDGSPINSVEQVIDLGVTLSCDGTFKTHINNVARKARGQAGWILRTFRTRETIPMLTLYKSLVVPLLEYCCQLWSPWRVGEIQLLEAVQRSFTNNISAVRHLDYWQRLEALDLFSLERRRERYAIIYVYKILCGQAINNVNICWKVHPRKGRLCHVQRPLTRAATRIKTLKENAFATRGPILFNALPKYLRDSHELSLEKFKNNLDKFLRTIPDQPKLPHYHLRSSSNSIVDQLAQRRADGVY